MKTDSIKIYDGNGKLVLQLGIDDGESYKVDEKFISKIVDKVIEKLNNQSKLGNFSTTNANKISVGLNKKL